MATKIVTKSGSGAPATTDLVAGELAVDLTNKRLYTENGSAAIIEVGSNPYNFTANHDGSAKLATTATGIDVTGSVTADGLTVSASATDFEGVQILNTNTAASPTTASILLGVTNSVRTVNTKIQAIEGGGDANETSLAFFTNTGGNVLTKAMTIDSSQNVGIGTSAIDGTLHVHTASAGTVAASAQADDLVIENSTEGGMTIITPDDQSARIRFTSPSTNTDVGGATIFYRQNINTMQIGTAVAGGVLSLASGAGATRMTIDSSGNVGIGITPAHKLSVFGTGVGNATVQIEGEGGADPYINFLTNNAQHWSLGVDDSDADKFKLSEHSALGTNDYFVVDVTGNVGIGTTSPKGKINSDVGDTSTVGAFSSSGLNITSTSGAANNIYQIGFGYASGATNAPASIYALTTSNAGFNNNAICFATRNVTTDTAPTERMRIDASGNVGIGTSSPQTSLSIETSGTQDVISPIVTGQTSSVTYGGLYTVRDGAGDQRGLALQVYTANVGLNEAMRIDSSGNLLVGKTATAFGTAGVESSASNGLWSTRSGNPTLSLNRLSSDGDIVQIYQDSALVGSIGTDASGNLQTLSATANYRFGDSNTTRWSVDSTRMYPLTDATYDIGLVGNRVKDLHLSGGVVFGDAGGTGTSTSNTLDDYEEGTWTPSFTGMGTGVYGVQVGAYTKVGNLVTASVHLNVDTLGTASGSLVITNLPFTASASSNNYGSASSIHAQNFTTAAEGLNVLITPNTAVAGVFSGSGSTSGAVNVTHAVMGTGNMLCTLVYFTT